LVRPKLIAKLQFCADRKCPAKVGRHCWSRDVCENQRELDGTIERFKYGRKPKR
jgi:hypothetical protein